MSGKNCVCVCTWKFCFPTPQPAAGTHDKRRVCNRSFGVTCKSAIKAKRHRNILLSVVIDVCLFFNTNLHYMTDCKHFYFAWVAELFTFAWRSEKRLEACLNCINSLKSHYIIITPPINESRPQVPRNNFQLHSAHKPPASEEKLWTAPASANTCIIDLLPEKWLLMGHAAWGEPAKGTWVIQKIIKPYTFNKSQSITAVAIKISCGFFSLFHPQHWFVAQYKRLTAKYFIMMMLNSLSR